MSIRQSFYNKELSLCQRVWNNQEGTGIDQNLVESFFLFFIFNF